MDGRRGRNLSGSPWRWRRRVRWRWAQIALADRVIDARNPRTANRPLVAGRIALSTAWVGTVVAGLVLVVAAWQLGPMPLMLLPGALLFLVGYAFTKRFTWLSHFVLGFTDGLAPMGAWVAVRGSLFTVDDLPAWLLLGVVTLWIGGFDLIYACQDVDFDREAQLARDSGAVRRRQRAGAVVAVPRDDDVAAGRAGNDVGLRLAVLARDWSSSRGCWSTSTRSSAPMIFRASTSRSSTSTATLA